MLLKTNAWGSYPQLLPQRALDSLQCNFLRDKAWHPGLSSFLHSLHQAHRWPPKHITNIYFPEICIGNIINTSLYTDYLFGQLSDDHLDCVVFVAAVDCDRLIEIREDIVKEVYRRDICVSCKKSKLISYVKDSCQPELAGFGQVV